MDLTTVAFPSLFEAYFSCGAFDAFELAAYQDLHDTARLRVCMKSKKNNSKQKETKRNKLQRTLPRTH